VPDVEAFISTMQSGVDAARSGYIFTFGVYPSFPRTAYGHIQWGSCLEDLSVGASSTYAVEFC
jgi:mannose-1-phosphate guanylyltransferase